MRYDHAVVLSLVVALAAALPAAISAQVIPSACQPLLEAQRKEIMTPHHSYQTETRRDGKATSGELISIGGATYILYDGKWRRSPITPQENLDQMKENIANATKIECHNAGTESVAGMAAAVYTSHNEGEAGTADARHWVATGSGMLLRTEEDIDAGGGDKRHISIRYDYTNVTAPAGVK